MYYFAYEVWQLKLLAYSVQRSAEYIWLSYLIHLRYWRCDIPGAPNGKLQGKSIAIKDCICVAGVPMMMGSQILEGYTPDVDATVVTRILDAGGRIMGKAVCENLCNSGGSFNAVTGPVVHPLDETRMTGGSSSGCAALVWLVNGAYILVQCNDQHVVLHRHLKFISQSSW